MARLAGKLSPATNYLVADGQRLPVADGAVAAVVGNFVLHHFPDPRRAVTEFARVTAVGGRLGLTVWDAPQRCRFLGVFNDSVQRAAAAVPATVPVGPPMAAGDADYADLLARAGYAPDPVRRRGWLHDFGDSTRLWEGLLASSVRTAALITEQDRPTRQCIRAAFEAVVEEYRTPGGGLHVPISVKIISGTRLR